MSFYITLPSITEYPNNTQSNYTTLFKPPIYFSESYEVAVTEFSCSSKFLVNLGELTFEEDTKTITIQLTIINGSDNETAIARLNSLIKENVSKEGENIPKFFYESKVIKIKCTSKFSIQGLISSILFGKEKTDCGKGFELPFLNNFSIIQYAGIYTDIIQDQFIGDSRVPLLQIFNLRPVEHSDTIHVYENPHYINVNKNMMSSINIRILDLQGEPLKFTDIFAVSILKLHFRKIKNE